jgi:hypothetical protein
MMDENKIIIINLSKGRVGEANANLLGSMFITKIYLAAMSRADVSEKELQKLPNFYLYVDEFQSFANESFADILSEARKYKLNLTIAHQYIEQMSEEVRAAVFGNVGTMITFRVGAFDAEILEKEFAPQFTAEDLVNLGFAQIYLKLMIDGVSSMPFSASTMPPIKEPERSYRPEVIEMSRKQFAVKRAEVEQNVIDWHKDNGRAPVSKAVNNTVEKKATAQTEKIEIPKIVVQSKPLVQTAKVFEKPKYSKAENTRLPRPTMPMPDDLPSDDFVSLKDLKSKITPVAVGRNNINAKKAVDEKSLSELRAVLQSLTKDKKQDNKEKKEEKILDKPKTTKVSETETSMVKEIPEDKLRQMLQVDINNQAK